MGLPVAVIKYSLLSCFSWVFCLVVMPQKPNAVLHWGCTKHLSLPAKGYHARVPANEVSRLTPAIEAENAAMQDL